MTVDEDSGVPPRCVHATCPGRVYDPMFEDSIGCPCSCHWKRPGERRDVGPVLRRVFVCSWRGHRWRARVSGGVTCIYCSLWRRV